MIKIIAKKYLNKILITTFQFETDNFEKISEKVKLLKTMDFQEIIVR